MTDLHSDPSRAKWHSGIGGFVVGEWPYLLMLLLALFGVAYTSFSETSIYTAGLHIRAWKIAVVGVILGVSVPAIAFLQQSALLILLVIGLIIAIVVPFVWAKRRPAPASEPLFQPPFTRTTTPPTSASARPVPQPPLYETPVAAPMPVAPPPAPTPSAAEPAAPPPDSDTPPDNVRNISGAR